MAKTSKFLLGLVIIIIISALATWFWHSKNKPQPTATWSLPGLSQLANANLPTNLVGPQNDSKAKALDPAKIIEWTNKYRADNNLVALKVNVLLANAAQSKVDDMFTNQYFEHVAPDGTTPAERVLKAGYNYKVTGENLALGDFKDEKDLVDAWMASPGHRENILNKDYTEIGVATGINNYQGRSTWLAAQEFGKPSPNCANPDANLANSIDSKKTQYQSLANQLNDLSIKAQDLANQANAKITQGNQIYLDSGSKSKAQPYWDEGKALKKQSDAAFEQVKTIDNQLKNLYGDINTLVNKYNIEINNYNKCIQS